MNDKMSDKDYDTDKVENVHNANDIALHYLSEQGIVVFGYEVTSIFKRISAWFVIIEGDKFNGVVIIKSKTGEVAKAINL